MTFLFEKAMEESTKKVIKVCLGLGIAVAKCMIDNYDEIKNELVSK